MRTRIVVAAIGAAVLLLPSLAEAQRGTTRRRQEPITIRGTVPTPQVVTVRPREVPAYGRNILVPNFYDRDFWAVILPAYLVVPERMVTGASPLGAGADSAMATGAPMGLSAGVAPTDSAGAALALPPLPPRPSRPFMRATGTMAPAGGQGTTPAGSPPAGTTPAETPPTGGSTTGASGTAPASPTR